MSAGDDKMVRVWDVSSASCLRSWVHQKKLACVEMSKDDQTVLFSDRFGEAFSVGLNDSDASPTLLLGHLSPISHLRLTSSGANLLTADHEGHVRSSQYPHAFIIERYFLMHTSPVQIMVTLSQQPLLLTAAAEGREVCLWKLHTGTLVEGMSATELHHRLAPSPPAREAEDHKALLAACECVQQQLLAFVFEAEDAVHFAAIECSWDAMVVSMSASHAPAIALPQTPISLECSPANGLCILTRTTVMIIPPQQSGIGFDMRRARIFELPPPPDLGAAEDETEMLDDDDAEMNDED